MEFVAQKVGNRVQIKSYKEGKCTKVTFLKYQKAFSALKRLEKQGHTVGYRVKGEIISVF